MRKQDFIKKFKNVIIKWAEKHEDEILDYKSYRWKGDYEESVKARNKLEEEIKRSRQENDGGIDLATADEIYMWGFAREFPLRNEREVIKATKEAFEFLDEGDCYQAAKRLMWISGVGPAGATKILGLSDQENFCIYDSRVGNALRDLTKHGKKIIRCPAGRGRRGDYVLPKRANHEWAEDYQKLIWTLEIIRDYLKEKSHKLRIADIEMALFMMGK